jgi:hypothetical protein
LDKIKPLDEKAKYLDVVAAHIEKQKKIVKFQSKPSMFSPEEIKAGLQGKGPIKEEKANRPKAKKKPA